MCTNQESKKLYVGTEFGLYVSLDGGKTYKEFMSGLPRIEGLTPEEPACLT